MTTADVDAPPPGRRTSFRRLPRRAVAAIVVVLALGVATAGWLAVRSRVDLLVTGVALAGFEQEPGNLVVAEDPAPGAAVAVYFVRNEGPVAATITVTADEPADMVVADLVGPETGPSPDGTGRRSVSLAPGEAAGVRLVLGFGCYGTNPDVAYGPNAVALDVTALGITRRVLLDLDPVPMIRSTVPIPSSC